MSPRADRRTPIVVALIGLIATISAALVGLVAVLIGNNTDSSPHATIASVADDVATGEQDEQGLQVSTTGSIQPSSTTTGNGPASTAGTSSSSTSSSISPTITSTAAIPIVTGMSVDAAFDVLEEQGFGVEIERRFTEASTPGTVLGQDPQGGSTQPSGTTVVLTAATAPAVKSESEGIEAPWGSRIDLDSGSPKADTADGDLVLGIGPRSDRMVVVRARIGPTYDTCLAEIASGVGTATLSLREWGCVVTSQGDMARVVWISVDRSGGDQSSQLYRLAYRTWEVPDGTFG